MSAPAIYNMLIQLDDKTSVSFVEYAGAYETEDEEGVHMLVVVLRSGHEIEIPGMTHAQFMAKYFTVYDRLAQQKEHARMAYERNRSKG